MSSDASDCLCYNFQLEKVFLRNSPTVKRRLAQGTALWVLMFTIVSCGESRKGRIDLAAMLDRAEIRTELPLIDIGTEAAMPHLIEGWSYNEKNKTRKGNETFVWGLGKRSIVEFYSSTSRDLNLRFKCFPKGAEPQQLTFVLNGNKQGTVPLTPPPLSKGRKKLSNRMAPYRLQLQANAVQPGNNRLEIHYSIPGKGIYKGGRQIAVRWDWLRFDFTHTEDAIKNTTAGISIPFGSQIDYYLMVPEKAELRISGLEQQNAKHGKAQIEIQREGQASKIISNLSIPSRSRRIEINTGAPALMRLSIGAVWTGPDSERSGAMILQKPELRYVQSDKPAISEVPEKAVSKKMQTPPNIVIYLVDTLRKDRLGCYGHRLPVSPTIDSFAKESIIFDSAVADSSWTRASVASLMSGLPPQSHGVNNRNDALSGDVLTLAETLSAAGYHTVAFVENGNVSAEFGFAQGFDEFVYPLPDYGRVSDWIKTADLKRPFFLYIHTGEPHSPYTPPAALRKLYAPEDFPDGFGSIDHLKRLRAEKLDNESQISSGMLSLYDAEVAWADKNFKEIIGALKSRGLYQNSLVAFTADHGEEFYEHQGWEHGETLYGEVINIPFIVKLPSSFPNPAHRRIKESVQLKDLFPSIIDVCSCSSVKLEGQKLFSGETRIEKQPAISYLNLDGYRAEAWTFPPWRLSHTWFPSGGANRGLFNLSVDPAEKVNLVDQNPVRLGYLKSLIRQSTPVRKYKPANAVPSQEVREHLKALGYVQ